MFDLMSCLLCLSSGERYNNVRQYDPAQYRDNCHVGELVLAVASPAQ